MVWPFRRKKKATQRTGVFRAPLHGGDRWYDPATVRAALNAADPEWAESVDLIAKAATPLPPAITTADPTAERRRRENAAARMTRLAAACRAAFDLPPLQPDGTGYADGECLAVLTAYLDYCTALLETTRPL